MLTDNDESMSLAAAKQALTTHMNFLNAYNLTDANVPLLSLDLSFLSSPSGPFREIRNDLLRGTALEAAFKAASNAGGSSRRR